MENLKADPGGLRETATLGALPERQRNPHPCPVVGIGASAGGLEAFQELFDHMPPDTGCAFVLIQHLPARHETLMPELLSSRTAMPVLAVTDETVVQANQVYVMPPNAVLTTDDCVLYASRVSRMRGRRSPIDRFFRSLAEDQEDEAVAIVLSGTGTDGALGLKTIKEHGGLTMVQTPETARFDSMPRSAILTGAVDHVVPAAEMPARLREHLRRLREGQGGSPERFLEEVTAYLGKICAILRRETGHDFRRYKESTLVRRVRRRVHESRASSVYAYVELLSQEAQEVDHLFRDLLISVTHFFRDPEAFDLLATAVVPRLFDGKDVDGAVRVWVPGCATGEEAYSIAMLLREHMDGLESPPQVQVFATDIDAQAIEAARQALYPEAVAGQVTPERLERFFVRQGNMYQVCREIRDLCLFSLHNLIADPPFSRLDLISCRNLLIYLEGDLQKKVLALCHYALRPGGYLFLGPSEMVTGQPELFRTIDKKLRLFQSRDTITRPPFSFPLGERGRLAFRTGDEAHRRRAPGQQEVARTFETVLLENYAPPCVVVNEWGDIVFFSPRTGRYLEAPPGSPRVNAFDMARKGLRLDVRTALHKAVSSRVTVVHENVAFEMDGQTQRVNVLVRPLLEVGEDPGLFMIVFQEAAAAGEGHAEAEPDLAVHDDPIVRRLEAELRSTKDHLQATLEELESSNEGLISSNEELLSMNEELQSANEELQTSKEELQSVNEELETVNDELKKKLEELDRANSERSQLAAIVESSQDGIIGKTLDGVITSWNGGAERMYGYTAQEALGRSIELIVAPAHVEQMGAVFAQLRQGIKVESFETVRVRKDGRRLDVSITFSPVYDPEGRLIGASGIDRDISDRLRAQETLREEARRKDDFLAMLGHELRNPLAPISNSLRFLDSADADEEQQARARKMIERQVHHLTRLVDDLLDISRISRGKILLRKARLDLVESVRATVEDQQPVLAAAGLAVDLDLPGTPLFVHGDPTRLAQLLGNILNNAGKFTDAGGRVGVSVRAEPAQGRVAIAVRDTGIGIPPELLERIFEPFSQADRDPARSRGGLGLGLALVKELAVLHGGSVDAASAGPGRGSEVTVHLPLAIGREEAVMSQPNAQDPSEPPALRRCLVIEDHADAAESLALLLRLAGHEAEVAPNAEEGIEKARQFRPDVVLCDIGLPGMDGYGVARALRADPELSRAYLIALTGYGQEEDRRRALEAGFDAHLTKPADFDTLRQLLANGGR